MTKTEILQKVQKGEIATHQAIDLLEKLDRKPPRFKVAVVSGWCSVYFDGLRRPCTLPSKLWLELLEHSDNLKRFIAANEKFFRNK